MSADLKSLSTQVLLEIIWDSISRYKTSDAWRNGNLTKDRQQAQDAMEEIAFRIEAACPELIRKGYKTKVGKGVGRFPKTPWISLLPKDQITSSGVYGVACINGDGEGYVVGPITSVTDKEISKNIQTIKRPKDTIRVDVGDYNDAFTSFKEVTRAEIYDNNIIQLIIEAAIEADKIRSKEPRVKALDQFTTTMHEPKDLNLEELLLSSLAASPFVILSGGTGSGKTHTAITLAKSLIGNDPKALKDQLAVIPVQANWTDRQNILGHRKMLSADVADNSYESCATIRLILQANANKSKPHFLILEEMNRSSVEGYFADFLSSMESGLPLQLHDCKDSLKDDRGNWIPPEINLPSNLFIIGTVNPDETNYQLSPKVIDCAHIIEFNITWEQIELGLTHKVRGLRKMSQREIDQFMTIACTFSNEFYPSTEILAILKRIHNKLNETKFKLSYRTAHECIKYVNKRKQLSDIGLIKKESAEQVLDTAILQKVLPKINGPKNAIEPLISSLLEITQTTADGTKELVRTHTKLLKMAKSLGGTSLSAIPIEQRRGKGHFRPN